MVDQARQGSGQADLEAHEEEEFEPEQILEAEAPGQVHLQIVT